MLRRTSRTKVLLSRRSVSCVKCWQKLVVNSYSRRHFEQTGLTLRHISPSIRQWIKFRQSVAPACTEWYFGYTIVLSVSRKFSHYLGACGLPCPEVTISTHIMQSHITLELPLWWWDLSQVEDNIAENLKQISENCANVNARIDKVAGKLTPKKTKKWLWSVSRTGITWSCLIWLPEVLVIVTCICNVYRMIGRLYIAGPNIMINIDSNNDTGKLPISDISNIIIAVFQVGGFCAGNCGWMSDSWLRVGVYVISDTQ